MNAPDRWEAWRAYGVFAVFLVVWIAYIQFLWATRALSQAELFWWKVPVWLVPVAVIAAFRRDWVRDFGLVGPPVRALAYAIGAALLVAAKEYGRVAWLEHRAPVWSPPIPTLLMGMGPLLEELLFRGALQPPLVRRHGLWLGIAITSLLFLLIHVPFWVLMRGPTAFTAAYIFGFGVFLGWLRHASGSLWAPLLAHWVNNIGARL